MFPNIAATRQKPSKAGTSMDARSMPTKWNRSFIEDYYASELTDTHIQNQSFANKKPSKNLINIIHYRNNRLPDAASLNLKKPSHDPRKRITRHDVEDCDDDDSVGKAKSPLFGYSEGERKRLAITYEYRKYARRQMIRRSRSSSPQFERIKAYAYQSKRAAVKIKTLINQRPENLPPQEANEEEALWFPYKDEETQVTPPGLRDTTGYGTEPWKQSQASPAAGADDETPPPPPVVKRVVWNDYASPKLAQENTSARAGVVMGKYRTAAMQKPGDKLPSLQAAGLHNGEEEKEKDKSKDKDGNGEPTRSEVEAEMQRTRAKTELREFLLQQMSEKRQRQEDSKTRVQQERAEEERRLEQEKQQLLQEFNRELAKSRVKLAKPRPEVQEHNVNNNRPSQTTSSPGKVADVIKIPAAHVEKESREKPTMKLPESTPKPILRSELKTDKYSKALEEQDFYFKKLESDIADISSEISAQQRQINQRIEQMKNKALEFRYKNGDTHMLLLALKGRIEDGRLESRNNSAEDEESNADSEETSGERPDIPSQSKFVAIDQNKSE